MGLLITLYFPLSSCGMRVKKRMQLNVKNVRIAFAIALVVLWTSKSFLSI